jgi:hypothetical protein
MLKSSFKRSLIALFLIFTTATYDICSTDEKENYPEVALKFLKLTGELFTKPGVAENIVKEDLGYVSYADFFLNCVQRDPVTASQSPLGLATALMLSRAEKPTETAPFFKKALTVHVKATELDREMTTCLSNISKAGRETTKRKLRAKHRDLLEQKQLLGTKDPAAARLSTYLREIGTRQSDILLKFMENVETKLRNDHR